ncbi:hypothetical protein EI94DRAFT_1085324 [Lactarius quietus]|nr:hypothetical protein EI94DRAFT_1085324 [Lactarius quietus]
MPFISPHSHTGPCTPVVGHDVSGTQGHQLSDRQSQRPYDNLGFGTNLGVLGQRSQTMPKSFGNHNIDISDLVASASEGLLEENAFYMRLKVIAEERMDELNKLQETIASQHKEIEALKIRCDGYQETIDLFAKNYVTLKAARDDPIPITLLPLPLPLVDDMKRETNRDSSSSRAKPKPGCPPKDLYEEYFYLENEDGTLVSREVIFRMSQKAQTIWEILDEHGLAPTTFDKISETAWEFYARSMLSDPEFFSLRLCDDGQWKLREWSNSCYSSWYDNRGLRRKKVKKLSDSIFDHPNPIQLVPSADKNRPRRP